MLLRTLVQQFIRQAAQEKIFEAVSGSGRGRQRAGREADDATGDAADANETREPEEIPPCDVAFVFALGVESGGLVDLVPDVVHTQCPSFLEHAGDLDGRRIVIADGGVGVEAAARATDDVITLHKPAWVVSAGFAGGLRDELRRGHIVMADSVADTHGSQLAVGLKLDPQVVESTPSLHIGRLLTVDHIIRTAEEKRSLAKQHDAIACDMETMAVAEVCRRHKVRFLSVRIISDAVDDHLPPEIDKLLEQKTLAAKLGAAAGAIFKRPSSVKDMWQLREDALKASDRLAKFLLGVVPQLTADDDE
jgi:adenosylhomocysteine nucleosidase